MSFLAQLRQQQASNEEGLKLCYLLDIDQDRHQAYLRLSLCELRQGRITGPGKDYLVQQAHLQSPPPFLVGTDLPLLQKLNTPNNRWTMQPKNRLCHSELWQLLQALLNTHRCFIQATGGTWTKLEAGEPEAIELAWEMDHHGQQQLHWRTPANQVLFYGQDDAAGEMIIWHSTKGTLALGAHGWSAEALALARTGSKPLRPEAVDQILAAPQYWQRCKLPLPRPVEYRNISASLTPVLQCFSPKQAEGGRRDCLQLRFRYSSTLFSVSVSALDADTDFSVWNGSHCNRIVRDFSQEQRWQARLVEEFANQLNLFETRDQTTWWSPNSLAWRTLLTEKRGTLEAQGFQFAIAPDFRSHYVTADQWQVITERGHNKQDDDPDSQQWRLSVQVTLNGEPIDLLALLAQPQFLNLVGAPSADSPLSLKLPDGRLLLLPADKVHSLMSEFDDLLQFASPNQDGAYSLPNAQLNRLHRLHELLPENTQWLDETDLLEQAVALNSPATVLDQAGLSIQAELRPYQWQAVCWLQHLRQLGANGLLADDMGLGKTLQTIAHLALEQQSGRLNTPALVVAPTSLLHNWAAEIQRFAPQLRSKIIHGPQRHNHWDSLNQYPLLITSYNLVVNDLERWQQQSLSWLILDEAQYIKNPRTQASQALRQLNSTHRLCLSGTPVENHLGELWSLLDFLMPRCLGSFGSFKQQYRQPIEQNADNNRMQQLRRRIAPFMLRRTKDQVAAELPPKTEIHQTIPLADDQRVFYDNLRSSGWNELQTEFGADAANGRQQIRILAALLKLRQACCDPALLGRPDIASAKRDYCIEMIKELVAEQRTVLLFSQFTTMLDLLARDLEQADIPHLLLTGQTRDRQSLVDTFQRSDVPVFLISLKAGGVGLNLTRADTVIHYDPWWNNAAEQQATDRAHRIGQDKPVFVYKLITENSIEDKILLLQQRKALLSEQINQQAQASGEQFALSLEELIALLRDDTDNDQGDQTLKAHPTAPEAQTDTQGPATC